MHPSSAAQRLAKFGIGIPAPSNRRRRTAIAFFCALGVVTAGLTTFLADIRSVLAFSDESAASFFRKDRAARQGGAATPLFYAPPSAPVARPLTATIPAGSQRPPATTTDAAKKKAAKKHTNEDTPAAVSLGAGHAGARSVCVRLCDGYHFPVADAPSGGGVAAHEAICSSTCPGAPTRLYVIPSGTDDISRAYSAREGRPYAALPVALRHTNKRDLTCSCRRNNESQASLVSLYRDFTLRSGDAVMTNSGFQVFRGAKQWPYKASDFTNVNSSRLAAGERRLLQRIEKASIPFNSSPREQPRATPRTTASPLPALGPFAVSRPEKQASNAAGPARLARAAQGQPAAN